MPNQSNIKGGIIHNTLSYMLIHIPVESIAMESQMISFDGIIITGSKTLHKNL